MTSAHEVAPLRELTRTEAEDFVYAEVALLDEARFREWLELFTRDGVYWIPANEPDHDPDQHVSIIHDTREQLADRITRLELGRAVREVQPRMLHLVSNVRVTNAAGGERAEVLVAMVVHEVHGTHIAAQPAHCRYLLRADSGGWRIARKTVVLLENDHYLPNLTNLY
jgi:3-phenylpropionate/cinnamic acid dioxygenase small subunit